MKYLIIILHNNSIVGNASITCSNLKKRFYYVRNKGVVCPVFFSYELKHEGGAAEFGNQCWVDVGGGA